MGNAQTISKQLTLIGAASCIGAKDTRCDMGPEVIKASNIIPLLKDAGIEAAWHGILRPPAHTADIDAITNLCKQIEQSVNTCVSGQNKFAVIGGDHSCAIGTWSGVSNALNNCLTNNGSTNKGSTDKVSTGLIWVDAHMDSHTPQTSPSGAYHGMPLACLLGHGNAALCKIGKPLDPQKVCLIGVRSFEHDEHSLLDKLGVRIFFADEIRQRGLTAVMDEAMDIVKDATGFGISIDLDAIDPVDAPGVGSPTQEGLQAEALLRELPRLRQNKNFLGAEITEFNPFRDVNSKTADLVVDLVLAMA